MRRCVTCDSYYPNPRCPACQPRIEEEYDPTFGDWDDDDIGPDLSETDPPTNQHQTMNTTDRQPTIIRETLPERQNKTARQIQQEIDWMRIAYRDRLDEQEKSICVIGWSLMAIAVLIVIIATSILIW